MYEIEVVNVHQKAKVPDEVSTKDKLLDIGDDVESKVGTVEGNGVSDVGQG